MVTYGCSAWSTSSLPTHCGILVKVRVTLTLFDPPQMRKTSGSKRCVFCQLKKYIHKKNKQHNYSQNDVSMYKLHVVCCSSLP